MPLGSVTVVTRPDVCGHDGKEFQIPTTATLSLLPVFAFLWDDLKPVGAVGYLDSRAEEQPFKWNWSICSRRPVSEVVKS